MKGSKKKMPVTLPVPKKRVKKLSEWDEVHGELAILQGTLDGVRGELREINGQLARISIELGEIMRLAKDGSEAPADAA